MSDAKKCPDCNRVAYVEEGVFVKHRHAVGFDDCPGSGKIPYPPVDAGAGERADAKAKALAILGNPGRGARPLTLDEATNLILAYGREREIAALEECERLIEYQINVAHAMGRDESVRDLTTLLALIARRRTP